MRSYEFIDERKKKRKKRAKGALYGPGPYGWYGFDSGYSGDMGGGVAEGEVIPFRRPQLTWQQVPQDILYLANEWFWASDEDTGLDAVLDPQGYGSGTKNRLQYITAQLAQRGWTIDYNDERDKPGEHNLILRNKQGQSVLLSIEDAQDFKGWAQGTVDGVQEQGVAEDSLTEFVPPRFISSITRVPTGGGSEPPLPPAPPRRGGDGDDRPQWTPEEIANSLIDSYRDWRDHDSGYRRGRWEGIYDWNDPLIRVSPGGYEWSEEFKNKVIQILFARAKKRDEDAIGVLRAYQKAGVIKEAQLNEKWSEKYKRSINCSNPQGFSQRAHCQGRKKSSSKKPVGEAAVGSITVGQLEVLIDEHALDRARERGVDPAAVDYIIKKQMPKVLSKMAQVASGEKIWVYDWSRETALGLRRISSSELKFVLKTVWPGQPAQTPTVTKIIKT